MSKAPACCPACGKSDYWHPDDKRKSVLDPEVRKRVQEERAALTKPKKPSKAERVFDVLIDAMDDFPVLMLVFGGVFLIMMAASVGQPKTVRYICEYCGHTAYYPTEEKD